MLGLGGLEATKLRVTTSGVDDRDARGSTPLHAAARAGDTDSVVFLLRDARANPMIVDDHGQSALHTAALQGHTPIVQLLVNESLSIDQAADGGSTALHLAASAGHVQVVDLLSKLSTTMTSCTLLTSRDQDDWSVLHEAAAAGHTIVVQRLLETKTVPSLAEAKAKDGQRPIHLAAGNGHLEVVKLLIDTNKPTLETESKVNVSLTWTDHVCDVFPALQPKGIVRQLCVACVCQNGLTALHHAASEGYTDVVTLLIDNGAHRDALTLVFFISILFHSHD
jgi:ankyrin repeat protein